MRRSSPAQQWQTRSRTRSTCAVVVAHACDTPRATRARAGAPARRCLACRRSVAVVGVSASRPAEKTTCLDAPPHALDASGRRSKRSSPAPPRSAAAPRPDRIRATSPTRRTCDSEARHSRRSTRRPAPGSNRTRQSASTTSAAASARRNRGETRSSVKVTVTGSVTIARWRPLPPSMERRRTDTRA